MGRLALIKSVLTSIPIYTLASVYILKCTIKRVEQIMCNFRWHVQGQSRVHWVKWEDICMPTEEGGLGIRCLSLIQDWLHGKLMWQVLQGSSLWARFAPAKFGRGNIYTPHSQHSPLWDSIVSHWPRLINLSQWIVGLGDISFWGDN